MSLTTALRFIKEIYIKPVYLYYNKIEHYHLIFVVVFQVLHWYYINLRIGSNQLVFS